MSQSHPDLECLHLHFREGLLWILLVVMGAPEVAGESIWPADGEYAGSKVCASCHQAQARSSSSSGMSRALQPVTDSYVLNKKPQMEFSDGDYRYLIERRGLRYLYQVSRGSDQVLEADLLFAFGRGDVGQTFVFRERGEYFESRVSYFETVGGLELTVGSRTRKPATIQEALGRKLSPVEVRECFGCHTTAARRGNILQFKQYEAGVQCEACHGPGAVHVADARRGKRVPGDIRRLRNVGAEGTNDLCGACHRTWETVVLRGLRGLNNARFQPYRLAGSKCFSDDSRIACTSCHDPHSALQRNSNSYDAKCTACHNSGDLAAKLCRVGKGECVSCHMPRIEIPGTFRAFTDHRIRIFRTGEEFPED